METLILMPSSPTLFLKTKRTPYPPPVISLSSSASSLFNRTLKLNLCYRKSSSRRRRGGMLCTCLFGLGVPELVVIAGVAALLFGPKQLPEVGRNIGKTVRSFQQAAKEFETELKKEPDTALESQPEKPTPTGEGKEEI